MKIYTKAGDGGETGLFGGPRVPKDDLRVEAYGAVDELNAVLGVVRARGGVPEIDALVVRVQDWLFTLGAELATPPEARARAKLPPVQPAWTAELETAIDRFEREVPPLRQFVLPAGAPLAADLHHARTVCRRAERRIVHLHREAPVAPEALAFVNRLSDFLFVAARLANLRAGVPEVPWDPGRPPP